MNPFSAAKAQARMGREFNQPRANWREALMELIAVRIALIQLESEDATRAAIRVLVFIFVSFTCAFFAWALLLASGIGLVTRLTGYSWFVVAFSFAVLHFIAGIAFVRFAKPSGVTLFPVTRAEFKKDREWIENFNKDKKSNA